MPTCFSILLVKNIHFINYFDTLARRFSHHAANCACSEKHALPWQRLLFIIKEIQFENVESSILLHTKFHKNLKT